MPDSNLPASEPGKPAGDGPVFSRTLETDGEIPIDRSDRSIPFHVCRSCGADNPLGVRKCVVCENPIGGEGQREFDVEKYRIREHDNEATRTALEEHKVRIDVMEEKEQDEIKKRRDEEFAQMKKVRPWRIGLAIGGAIVGIVVPLMVIFSIRQGRYFWLMVLVPPVLLVVTLIRHIVFSSTRSRSMYE